MSTLNKEDAANKSGPTEQEASEVSKKRKLGTLMEDETSTEEGKTRPTASESEVRQWLGGMGREEAISFIASLAVQNSHVMDAVQKRIRADPTFTKIFVRSLSWETSDDSLHKAFEVFGEIDECVVVRDQQTQRSKGFGFVTFKEHESVQRALQEPKKLIDGRETICHLASEKFERKKQRSTGFGFISSSPSAARSFPTASSPDTKLFIHGLAWETTSETLQQVFQQFGPIVECAVVTDKLTGRSKGFGFVTYHSAEHAQFALKEPVKVIDGRQVNCHMASERGRGSSGGQSGPKFYSSTPVQQQMAQYNPQLQQQILASQLQAAGQVQAAVGQAQVGGYAGSVGLAGSYPPRTT